MPLPEQIDGAETSLSEMSDDRRALLAPLLPHLAALDPDDFFALVVDRTAAGLVDLVAGR